MEMPEPVLKWREPFNRSALDLPTKPMVVQPSELQPADPTTIKLRDDDDKKGSITCTYLIFYLFILPSDYDLKYHISANFSDPRPASPPPAYIRSLRS